MGKPITDPVVPHTPGPWLARDYKTKEGGIWIDCDAWTQRGAALGGTLATASGTGCGEGQIEANARLIATSPELLAVCRKALPLVEAEVEAREHAGIPAYVKPMKDLADELRAVLAKVEGAGQ